MNSVPSPSGNTVERQGDRIVKTFGSRIGFVREQGIYEKLSGTGLAPRMLYAQDGVIVFEPLHIALLAPNAVIHRPDGPDIIKLKAPQPLPHTVSALDGFMPRRYAR